jgi:site-specific recombinase XerD
MVIEAQNIIKDLVEYRKYLVIKGYKKSTIKYLMANVKEYVDYQSQHKTTLQEYFSYLENRINKNNPQLKLSNSSLNGIIYSLEKYFHYLEFVKNQEQINQKVATYKEEHPAIDYLTAEEVQNLFKAIKSPRDRLIACCLYHLGLRASEAVNLKKSDIDLKNKLVFIIKSKTGYQRYVPMNKTAQTIIKEYLKNHHTDYLLTGIRGPLKVNSLSRIIKKYVQAAKIKKRVYAHLLRHSVATHLLHQGMELEKIAQFLGHRNMDSTQRYTHF